MRKIAQHGYTIVAVLGIAYCASAAPLAAPRSPQVSVGGLRLDPEDVISVSVSGPSFARMYVWTEEEAERAKGPRADTLIADYPNRLLALYTEKGFLVVKWNRWEHEKRPHDANHVDVYTMINLSQVVYVNVNDYGNEKYRLRIELAKTE